MDHGIKLTHNEISELANLVSNAILDRSSLMNMPNGRFSGRRRLNEVLGYKDSLTFSDYEELFDRGDIARAVIKAYPEETWRLHPAVTEDGSPTKETKFEKAWRNLVKSKNIFHYLRKVDILSGIGRYGILWMGFDDATDLYKGISGSRNNLIFLRPLQENKAIIESYDSDTNSPRYGLPKLYKIKTSVPLNESLGVSDSTAESDRSLHYSRVIHVAEDTTNNDIFGTPRLKPVFNRLDDLAQVAGGSAEGYWRGAIPTYVFRIDTDVQRDNTNADEVQANMSAFVHQLQHYIRLKGIDVKQFAVSAVDPTSHADLQITLIAATVRIPKRVLIGSERGELASSQDEGNWAKMVASRQSNYVEPVILRPFIDRLISVGALPEPKNGYSIKWPDLVSYTPADKATTANRITSALYNYAREPEVQNILPPEAYLKYIMGFLPEDIDAIKKMIETAAIEDRSEPTEEELDMMKEILDKAYGPKSSPSKGEPPTREVPGAAPEGPMEGT